MIPVSEIQRVIADYERRIVSASKLMAETQDTDQFHRVAGKHESYVTFVRELKELIPSENDSSRVSGNAQATEAEQNAEQKDRG